MTNKIDILSSVEKETQYLKETREYINSLKNDLIEKILFLQQNKKTGVNPKELNHSTNVNDPNKFSLAAGTN